MDKPITLGLFVSTTQNSFETAVYTGVCDIAQTVSANVICFTSGALRSYRGFEFQRNVLFDLVNAHNVDGLIISGTLAHPISAAETQAFFKRYENIPKISIALSMPGTPNVMVASQPGIRALVEHLIKVHGYQRFGFIRGPIAAGSDVGKLTEGMPVRIQVGALPGKTVAGKLSRIAPKAREKEGATVFDVEVAIEAAGTEIVLRARLLGQRRRDHPGEEGRPPDSRAAGRARRRQVLGRGARREARRRAGEEGDPGRALRRPQHGGHRRPRRGRKFVQRPPKKIE